MHENEFQGIVKYNPLLNRHPLGIVTKENLHLMLLCYDICIMEQ